jgi:hypothetical protein
MCSGKDYVAIKAGYHCVSIAEPLYRLSAFYLGTNDKKIPEVRSFMQALGAWGRGEEGPPSGSGLSREQVFDQVRRDGAKMTGLTEVDWKEFGTKKTFWLSSAATVAEKLGEGGKKVAITNARFPEELEELKSRGFKHIHVMCTEASRLNRAGRPYTPAIDEDATEQMAIGLNEKVYKNGAAALPDSTVVWSDHDPVPYKGLVTVQSFVLSDEALNAGKLPRAQRAILPSVPEKASRVQ